MWVSDAFSRIRAQKVVKCNEQSLSYTYTKQKRASCIKPTVGLLPCCHPADIRMGSHCLLRLDGNKFAASCMSTAGLLQVDCQDFLSTNLMQVVSATCSKSANIKLQQVLFSQTFCNFMNSTDLLQLVDNFQQASKIHNLQQVCGVSGAP